MSGDCDLCGSYDHVETRCPSSRLNDDFGCVRCGILGCEWANGVGTQHRVMTMTQRTDRETRAAALQVRRMDRGGDEVTGDLTDDLASAVVRELHAKRWCRCPDLEPMLCVESVEVVRSVLDDEETP